MDFTEWLIKKLLQSLTEKGMTDRAKIMAAYERFGRILTVVQAEYTRLGEILKPQQPIG